MPGEQGYGKDYDEAMKAMGEVLRRAIPPIEKPPDPYAGFMDALNIARKELKKNRKNALLFQEEK
jgi:hypothetical protein